jgi:phosphoribosylformylglycinamidine (FGAM) synthase PurS component
MATYDVTVVVEYMYEVEADSEAEAIEQGWQYEDYAHFASVDSIDVTKISEDEDEDE